MQRPPIYFLDNSQAPVVRECKFFVFWSSLLAPFIAGFNLILLFVCAPFYSKLPLASNYIIYLNFCFLYTSSALNSNRTFITVLTFWELQFFCLKLGCACKIIRCEFPDLFFIVQLLFKNASFYGKAAWESKPNR